MCVCYSEHLSDSNLVEVSSTAVGRGLAAKVLHERVLDLTAAVVFPGSRSSYPLISNRTKNVSLAPTIVMMIIIAADEEYDDNWMADNDNDDDNYKANSRHRVVKVNGTRHQPPAIGSSLYTILYSSLICYKGYIGHSEGESLRAGGEKRLGRKVPPQNDVGGGRATQDEGSEEALLTSLLFWPQAPKIRLGQTAMTQDEGIEEPLFYQPPFLATGTQN